MAGLVLAVHLFSMSTFHECMKCFMRLAAHLTPIGQGDSNVHWNRLIQALTHQVAAPTRASGCFSPSTPPVSADFMIDQPYLGESLILVCLQEAIPLTVSLGGPP